MLMTFFRVGIERDVFAFLIQLDTSCGRQALGQGGLTIKLVRKLARCKHRLGMHASGLAHAGIEL